LFGSPDDSRVWRVMFSRTYMYRVDRETTYKHIDALFTQVVDWELIERYWHDMMQVVLSIQAGKVLPSMLLQKLGVYSRQSTLYRAFSELGRVERTRFLL
jgi:TnpA family transposase